MSADVSALLRVAGLPKVTQHISRSCRIEPKAPESWPGYKANCTMGLFVAIKRSISGDSLVPGFSETSRGQGTVRVP